MMKSFFNTLSYIFHPIFLPLLGLYFLFSLPSTSSGLIEKSLYVINHDVKTSIYLIYGTLLIIAPGISILIMIWSKTIKSIQMKTQIERTYAIGTLLIYSGFTYSFLRKMLINQPNYELLLVYTFAITLLVLISFIINFYTKISLHAVGIFGLIGAIIGYFNLQINYNIYFILVLILVGGLITAGRLYLKAHHLKDVLLGMIIGFTVEFLCFKFEWFL